ncbi:hypothetical protein ACP275_04G131900 [Erythranthe tilingii]
MIVDDYKFLQIKDATACINQQVNLIGVVVETSAPKQSRGTDLFCSVKIIDESWPLGFHIKFFAETRAKLPYVDTLGDIIIVTHVVVQTMGSEVVASFKKRSSSFALFEGRECSGKEFVPYKFSPNYKPRDQDKKFITGLRKWCMQQKVKGLNELPSFKDIKEGKRLNLLCKILHIYEVKKNEWMLFVWDGTDTPPLSVEAKLEDEMENPLPLDLDPSPLPRDILCTFPAVGTVLRIIVDQGNESLGIKFLKTNKWVKIISVKCEIRASLWRAVLMPFSRICYLPELDTSVVQRQRLYNERLPSTWGRMPFTCFPWPSYITETEYPDVPFVTLMNVLTHEEVTYKYRCVVRVVAIFPWRVEDFRSPSGIYRLRLTLEDPTARIHAFLYAEDGTKFFGDFDSMDVLREKRDMLLGVPEEDKLQNVEKVSRNPPWIQCCLKSYYTDKSDVWGSRNFRIFDTTFVG